MSFLYLKGLAENLITTASTYSSSSENTDYPNENIGSGFTGKPFKFNAAAADDTVTVDLGSSKTATFVSVHGHNIDTGVTAIQLRKSNDNFSANDVLVATLTKSSPTFFATFASTSERYWRLKFVGTNGSPIEIGEWGLGAHNTLASTIKITSLAVEPLLPQSRQSGQLVPRVRANPLTTHRQRLVDLGLRVFTFANRDVVEGWFVDTKFGAEPFIVVPDDNDSIVIHGRLPERLRWEREEGANEFNRTSFQIQEDPFAFELSS